MLRDRRLAASDRFEALRCARVLAWPLEGDDAMGPVAGRAEQFPQQYTFKLWVFGAAALRRMWKIDR